MEVPSKPPQETVLETVQVSRLLAAGSSDGLFQNQRKRIILCVALLYPVVFVGLSSILFRATQKNYLNPYETSFWDFLEPLFILMKKAGGNSDIISALPFEVLCFGPGVVAFYWLPFKGIKKFLYPTLISLLYVAILVLPLSVIYGLSICSVRGSCGYP